MDAPGEESADDPVRLGGALRLAEVRSPWAGLIDFIEYGDAAYRAELKYRAKETDERRTACSLVSRSPSGS